MPVGQSSLFKQFSQSGPTGTQICWPNPTSNQLISVHLDWGNHSSKAFLVSSGVFVPLGPVHPNRLLIRWTWVSTPVMIKGHFSFQGRTYKLVIHQGFGHRPPNKTYLFRSVSSMLHSCRCEPSLAPHRATCRALPQCLGCRNHNLSSISRQSF